MARVRTHTNPLNIKHRFDKSLLKHLDSTRPLDVEIGFGRGVFLRSWATQNPDRNIVGIEVRKQMVDILDKRINDPFLPNALIFHGNGSCFVEDCIKDFSIDRIFVFHPDPWFKKRHHKRRLIQKEFLQLIFKKLKPEGLLCVSTDVEELWKSMNDDILKNGFKITNDIDFWDNSYNSHWQDFSIKEKRYLFQNSFIKN